MSVERFFKIEPNGAITNLVRSFGQDDWEIVIESLYWINQNIKQKLYTSKNVKQAEWRSRTAATIFESKEANGCSDFAILFLAFMSAANIKSSFIEAISEASLINMLLDKKQGFIGHVFCRIYIQDRALIVDPTNSQLFLQEYLPQRCLASNHYIIAEGKDHAALGIYSVNDCFRFAKHMILRALCNRQTRI